MLINSSLVNTRPPLPSSPPEPPIPTESTILDIEDEVPPFASAISSASSSETLLPPNAPAI